VERKTKTLMLSTLLVLAILSGIAVIAYANSGMKDTNAVMAYANGLADDMNPTPDFMCGFGGRHRGGMGTFGWGRGVFITVSEEFKDNVINIAKNDSDVQTLLNDGYNVTDVRPIINATVEADG